MFFRDNLFTFEMYQCFPDNDSGSWNGQEKCDGCHGLKAIEKLFFCSAVRPPSPRQGYFCSKCLMGMGGYQRDHVLGDALPTLYEVFTYFDAIENFLKNGIPGMIKVSGPHSPIYRSLTKNFLKLTKDGMMEVTISIPEEPKDNDGDSGQPFPKTIEERVGEHEGWVLDGSVPCTKSPGG